MVFLTVKDTNFHTVFIFDVIYFKDNYYNKRNFVLLIVHKRSGLISFIRI